MAKRKTSPPNEEMATASILEYFASVPDPRLERSKLHPLASVLVLSLCAVVCGADSFVAIEHFGRAREAWLKTFLHLPNGIPSHDTIGRIFGMLDPPALQEAFRRWVAAIASVTEGEVVAIDGKTLRRSFQHANRTAFVHMVSAWAAGNRMVLGQVKTEDKSNEISAIPRLLELLQIKGCLVTIDAMGCQKDIAKKIVERGADYMLAVKENQPTLSAAVSGIFDEALSDPDSPASVSCHTTEEKGHGRAEVRRCWTLTVDQTCGAPFDDWVNISTIVRIERERTIAGKTSFERSHYIASHSLSAPASLAASRAHWGVESAPQAHGAIRIGKEEHHELKLCA